MGIKDTLKKLDRWLFDGLRRQYIDILKNEVQGFDSLLDVGCGSDSPVKYFSDRIGRCVGVDAFQPSIDSSSTKRIHGEYHLLDVLEIGKAFPERSFDGVIALDLIEHLPKPEGLALIAMMERIARKKVIVFTPNGFLEQREHYGNKYQVHQSGWTTEEMRSLGYRVTGVNGWKPLRGESANIKWRPGWLWMRISLLSQPFTRTHPRSAFAILCIKDLI